MADKARLFIVAWRAFYPDLAEPKPEFKDAIPGRRYRFDYAFPWLKVAVEVDGGQWLKHGGAHNRDEDRERNNICIVYGWDVFRVSTQVLETDPEPFIDMVAQFVTRRGWE